MARPSTLAFLKTESGAGLVLALAAAAAMAMANSPWSGAYFTFIHWSVPVRLASFDETRSVLDWTKDGLMAVFFLVVGMEIKFEVLRGELSDPRRLALPLLAALGGMAVPAILYLVVNVAGGGPLRGWPIPTATDIAFGLAALAMVGARLPPSLRLFLLTLAIADDLGAVGLIGLLFTTRLDVPALIGAALALAALAALSRWRRTPFLIYAAGFLVVWAFTLKSGINTSVAGVACALTVPIGARRADQESVLKSFMDGLHPWVAFAILPLFAFTATGFSFRGLSASQLLAPLPVGVALGLFLGKPAGVLGASLLAAGLRLGRRPSGATWLELAGVAMLCGAGFTMSLFIGALAFGATNAVAQGQVRVAVVAGSIASVLAGAAVLALAGARRGALERE